MNLLQKIARRIIKKAFDSSVSTIEKFNDMEVYKRTVSELRDLENGTLGKEIVTCLDNHGLTFVPNYESHDLKHVLLDYKMTAEDEIRMQAFMLGNGNYTIPCFAILIFGAILLPDLWPTFYKDYRKGRNSIPISKWTIEDYAKSNSSELRLKLNINNRWNFWNAILPSLFIFLKCSRLSRCRFSIRWRSNFNSWRASSVVKFITHRKEPACNNGLKYLKPVTIQSPFKK